MKTSVVHMPRLDTILMVEDVLEELDFPPTKNQLWRMLPKMVMWQTFNVILEYLEKSNKIEFNKEGEIVWIFPSGPKAKKIRKKKKHKTDAHWERTCW